MQYRCMYSSCTFLSQLYFNLGLHELRFPFMKEQYTDRSNLHNEDMKSNYGNQMSELESILVMQNARTRALVVLQRGTDYHKMRQWVRVREHFSFPDWIFKYFVARFKAKRPTGCIGAGQFFTWYILEINVLSGSKRASETAELSNQ